MTRFNMKPKQTVRFCRHCSTKALPGKKVCKEHLSLDDWGMTNRLLRETGIRQGKPNFKTMKRSREEQRFYQSKEWKAAKNAYLEDNPLCVRCERQDIPNDRCIVDHIIPIKQLPRDRWLDDDNFQTLCVPCHSRKTQAQKQGEYKDFRPRAA